MHGKILFVRTKLWLNLQKKNEKMREENYAIYFLDQSYINAHLTGQKEWQAEEKIRKNATGNEWGTYNLCSYNGLVDNCQLIFKTLIYGGE